jgi:GAF domain-containing protein
MTDPDYPIPPHESERLEALRRYGILDTAREASFDAISRLAAFICATPIAAVTLVDNDRQWFKATVGLGDIRQTPREQAFCGHTIQGPAVMIVEDASEDARFAENALVKGNPHIRFYAGAPLTTSDDQRIGALCVIDTVPRTLSPGQQAALTDLARLVMTQLELRRTSGALADSLREVKALRDILPTCSYCSNIRNEAGEWNTLLDYIMDETTTRFSHGVCPTCAKVHFPNLDLFPANK